MPRIPKWPGDTMETILSGMMIPARVSRATYIFPDQKRIVMEGDFTKTKYSPVNVIEFRVTDTDREYIQRTLDSLPPKTREVFLLCRQEHKSHEEIATLLGISRIAVKKHMHRSNQAFRNTIHKELVFFILLMDALTGSN